MPPPVRAGEIPQNATEPTPTQPLETTIPETNQEPLVSDALESFNHAYDLGLLDRARRDWRDGAWARLQDLTLQDISQHPDRARLAMFAAAGHHAIGDTTATRQYASMAIRWGCDRKLVARTLIGGVHNTLARAVMATGRQRERALRHFEQAVAAGAPGSSRQLALHSRALAELTQMGLEQDMASLRSAAAGNGQFISLGNPLRDMSQQLLKQRDELATAIKKQGDELAKTREGLEATVKRSVLNATKQIEAFVNLQGYLGNDAVIPELHGWPISPDFALLLVSMLESNDYDLVIEFGSGSSTAIIATALARLAARRAGKLPTIQLAFEHLEEYFLKSNQLLESLKSGGSVNLQLSPLVPYSAANGNEYRFYDCSKALSEISTALSHIPKPKLLVLVDGPPGSTCKHARYPALPFVLNHFRNAETQFLLDDYNREEEKQVSKMWRADLAAEKIGFVFTGKNLEKDACIIKYPVTDK